MRDKLRVLFFMAVVAFTTTPCFSLPRFAVEEGVACASCHVTPTGGGKRNDAGGRLFTDKLSLKATRKFIPKDIEARLFKYITAGGDVFTHNVTALDSPVRNSTLVPRGNFYLELSPIKYLTGYVDYDFANTYNRESYVMFHHLPIKSYVRAGRIGLPYGLRIDDDTSPIRSALNMTFLNQDLGVEFGMYPKPVEIQFAVSNGVPAGVADENLAKAVSFSSAWIGKFARVGASFHWNKRPNVRITQAGVHAGFKLWRLIWLAEADAQQTRTYATGSDVLLSVGYSELNWRVIHGLYVKALYDFIDPDLDTANNTEHRFGGGADLYPLPHAKISLLYRHATGTMRFNPSDELLARVGFFF